DHRLRSALSGVPSVVVRPGEAHNRCVAVRLFFFFMIRGPPGSTLFPYATLFRSLRSCASPRSHRGRTFRCSRCSRAPPRRRRSADRKSTRLNSSHVKISYAVFCLKKKKKSGVPSEFPNRHLDQKTNSEQLVNPLH